VGLSSAELGRQVENGGGPGPFSRKATHHLGGQAGEALGQVSALKELLRFLVDFGGASVAHLVQVHRKLGGVQGLSFPQVFPGNYYLVPRLKGHFCPPVLVWPHPQPPLPLLHDGLCREGNPPNPPLRKGDFSAFSIEGAGLAPLW
jgi:hypothetical protein